MSNADLRRKVDLQETLVAPTNATTDLLRNPEIVEATEMNAMMVGMPANVMVGTTTDSPRMEMIEAQTDAVIDTL